MTRHRLGAVVIAAVVVIAGCGAGGPILANPTPPRPSVPPPTEPPAPVVDPIPVELPRDDAPHERLTEWWYYTGHLQGGSGERYGFEYVIFRAERGRFPVTWASHLAVTDETGGRFTYAERSEIGPQVDLGADVGFSFALSGFDPTRPDAAPASPWRMTGNGGTDRLQASAAAEETKGDVGAVGLDLLLRSRRDPVLHDRDGWIDFGPAGGSYYYSRTRMDVTGALQVGSRSLEVTGTAWFDHQWGDFISVGGGGWDWFAVNLEDGTDLTLSLVRDADGSYPLVYGTLVEAGGATRHLPADAFSVAVTDEWRSPSTGATYPAGWIVEVPGEALRILLVPTVPHQELDTQATTGVIYWEGSQRVAATRGGRALGGEAYIELTGYAPSELVVP